MPWNNRKAIFNDMLDVYGWNYDDAKILTMYRFELLVGEDWSESLMKYSGLEFGTRLDI